MLELRCDSPGPARRAWSVMPYFQEKLDHHINKIPVPETDTGRLVENTKGRERTLSKELGKLAL